MYTSDRGTSLALLRSVATLVACAALVAARARRRVLETKSPHFTVVSNAGQKTAESVALQFERVRSMFKKQWAWARWTAPSRP